MENEAIITIVMTQEKIGEGQLSNTVRFESKGFPMFETKEEFLKGTLEQKMKHILLDYVNQGCEKFANIMNKAKSFAEEEMQNDTLEAQLQAIIKEDQNG